MIIGFFSLPGGIWFWCVAYFVWPRKKKDKVLKAIVRPATLEEKKEPVKVAEDLPAIGIFNNECPYCKGSLPAPTRKMHCPHCNKIIFCRTRPEKTKQWVREEDIIPIMKEWADFVTEKDKEKFQETGEQSLHLARENIRQWVQGRTVKTLSVHIISDNPCEYCKRMAGKEFPLSDRGDIAFAMDNAIQFRECKQHCGCYWTPEKISIE